jgi:pimeloyl-ACP methyl ester carboxylesterase
VTFPESGHVPHIEEPEAVAAAVVEFCGREEHPA